MVRCKSVRFFLVGRLVLAVLFLAAGQSAADWKVYVAPGIGLSNATVDTDGQVGPPVSIVLNGSDHDSSPVLSFAVGLEVPMDELVPREWLLDIRLPDWPVRVEIEAAGRRQYQFRTNLGAGADFFGEIQAATGMVNFWLDIPMVAIYKPIQYTFSLGRQPLLRRWLDRASIYAGVGVGLSSVETEGRSNIAFGDDDSISFAWNAGLGLNYALTNNVSLSTGYRFIGLGERTIDLTGVTPGPNDEVEFTPFVHEFRVAIRIRVFEFFSPWR